MIDLKEYATTLRDPLCATTRSAKKNLLIFAVLGVLISKANFIPKKISLLGVELSEINSKALMVFLLIATLYYLFTFTIYLMTEVKSWRLLLVNDIIKKYMEDITSEDKFSENVGFKIGAALGINNKNKKEELQVRNFLYFRILAESVLPVLFSVYASIVLLNACFDGHFFEQIYTGIQKLLIIFAGNGHVGGMNQRGVSYIIFVKFAHSSILMFCIASFYHGMQFTGNAVMFCVFSCLCGFIGLFIPLSYWWPWSHLFLPLIFLILSLSLFAWFVRIVYKIKNPNKANAADAKNRAAD